tara:strand:+ start:123 stop:785 length:663 start_codon:yes stop_codon:yes gene_type:complete
MKETKASNFVKIHLGCGKNALDDFMNFDNNIFLLFKHVPLIEKLLGLFNFVPKWFCEFIAIAKKNDIRYCDASKRLPFKDSTVDLIYSCHMLEHLDKKESNTFFEESYRVLKDNGLMRIVVPDFNILIEKYKNDNDVENFIRNSCLVGKKPKTIIKKLQYLLQGHGWHHQMFNKDSLIFFKRHKFSKVELLDPGKTNLNYETSINYNERDNESLYFEFIK